MSGAFWDGPVYQVVKKMKATGNQPGVIAHWKAMVAHWAERANTPDAAAVKAWLPAWQVRPFYTAAELAPLMPALAVTLGVKTFSGRMPPVMSPARLANALHYAGLPSRIVRGQEFFIVERVHYWPNAETAELEELLP